MKEEGAPKSNLQEIPVNPPETEEQREKRLSFAKDKIDRYFKERDQELSYMVDLQFPGLKEEIIAGAEEASRYLFDKARTTKGKERLDNVVSLNRLLTIVNSENKKGEDMGNELLKNLLTNEEAVKELFRKGEEEVKNRTIN